MKKSKLEKKLRKLQANLDWLETRIDLVYETLEEPVVVDEEDDCDCDYCSNPEVELDVVADGLACELCLNDFINNLITRVDSQAKVIESQTETIISQAEKLRGVEKVQVRIA